MLEEYKKKAGKGIGWGIPIIVFAHILARSGTGGLATIISIVGAVLFIWGCCSWMKGKGYSSAWGLLGIFFIVGLIILAYFLIDTKELNKR